MKYNYIKNFICGALLCITISNKAQNAFSETFGTGASWPAGWTLANPDWITDMSNCCGGGAVECNVVGSSSTGVMVGTDGGGGIQRTTSRPFSTLAFSSMTLTWNGYRTTGAPTLTLEISNNNTTWTNLAFTDVATDNAWHTLAGVAIPIAFEGQSNVYLRWSYNTAGAGSYIAFDDILVTGPSTPIFYWDGVGAINQLSSWSDIPGGGGINPGSFTTNDQFFNMLPVGGTSSATLSGAWTIGGNNTVLNIGDGTAPFSFVINATLTFAAGSAAPTMVAHNTSTIVLKTTASATIAASNVVLNTGSTIDFAQTSTVNLWASTFSNLTISGGADKAQVGSPTVNGILNLNGSSLIMNGSSFQTLTLNGTITGAGTIKTGNSKLTIGGTGTFGTVTFGIGTTTRTINQLIWNRTSSGLMTLGSDLTISATSNLSNGQINLNGKNLTMNGAITFPNLVSNGNFIGSTSSSLTIGGSGAITNSMFFDQTSSSTRAMKDVFLNRSGTTITLGNALEIWGSLTPSVGTIASGSNLTIKSTAAVKGRIGTISATGFFTGTPTIEVFHKAGLTGWVNLCSGGVNGQTMNNWSTSFAITCSNCPYTNVGGSPFTSVYAYDETTLPSGNAADANHYIGIDATGGLGTSISSNKGYWVYMGDGNTNTNAITIPLTGAVNTKVSGGSNVLTLTGGVNVENGWSLISNPYPSPILVSQVIASAGGANVDNTLLSYDPNGNVNAPYTAAGTNSIIPTGQAFMIRTLVNNLTLTPAETWKTTTSSNVDMFRTAVAAPAYFYDDFMLELTGPALSLPYFAQAYFTFGNGNTAGFDNGRDAFSLASSVDPGTPRIISLVGGSDYMRNALPALTGTVVIPVKVATGYAGVYSINPVNLNKLPAGACVNLYHISTGLTHNLRNGAYTTTLSANPASNQFELRITVNATNLTSTVVDPVCKKNNTGLIKATGTTAGPWNYTWKDAANNVVRTMNNMLTADTLKNIYEGAYYVDISTTGSCDNARGTFNLLATTPAPVALFSANTNSVNDESYIPVSFTNNSSNAVNYTWDFGDGTNANTTHASHVFLGAGSNYVVTLTADNGACADISVATTVIQVQGQSTDQPNSINTNSFTDNSMMVGKDENGVYVQMNFDQVTKVDVTVTNILGQKIIAKKQMTGDKDKIYLSIPENEKMIFVTVATENKKQTVKIIN